MHRTQLDSVRQNRQIARQAARKHGINPTLFLRQMRQEAGFRDATSPAGAQGPAQIMPATARGWGVRNVHDPHEAYDAAAKHMADYLHQFGGSWAKALTAYNAGPGAVGGHLPSETQHYIATILHGGDDHVEAAPTGPHTTTPGRPARLVPGETKVDDKAALLDAVMQHGKPGTLLKRYTALIQTGNYTTTTPDKVEKGKPSKTYGVQATAPTGGGRPGKVTIAPNANRPGVDLNPQVVDFISGLAGRLGRPLTIGTGTNHNRMTTSGNVSDHWDGNGADVPMAGAALTRAGQAALIAAGMPRAQARKVKGGLFNIGGWQIIFNSNIGGNHFNHLHVGRRH